MTARKNDNRRFQTGGGMFRLGATYECHCCKRMTRETGHDESSLGLCAYCLEESYLENSLSDGNIEQPEFEASLDKLQKQYKRGKYAQNEADKKTRKIQSSRYVAPVAGPSAAEVDVAVTKLVKELKANAPAINKVLKTKPVVVAEWPVLGKGKEGNKLAAKVGRGIEQVMQLDDAGVLREFGLEVVASNKASITIAATRKDLINFRNACADRISSQYDQPLWYMSSAKATVAKIDAALKGGK